MRPRTGLGADQRTGNVKWKSLGNIFGLDKPSLTILGKLFFEHWYIGSPK
jgi:hypothetical protein